MHERFHHDATYRTYCIVVGDNIAFFAMPLAKAGPTISWRMHYSELAVQLQVDSPGPGHVTESEAHVYFNLK
jgi:hypothetical protein